MRGARGNPVSIRHTRMDTHADGDMLLAESLATNHKSALEIMAGLSHQKQ